MNAQNDSSNNMSTLSHLVAVKVAGWTDVTCGVGPNYGRCLGDKPTFRDGKIVSYACDQLVPRYSVDVESVLPLLEAMKAKGWWVYIKDHNNGINCGKRDWLVILTNYDDCCDVDAGDPGYPKRHAKYFEGCSPKLSTAICRALLRAHGCDQQEVDAATP